MAVDKHPSRMPSPPRKPPTTSPGGLAESGQPGVHYGARHTLKVMGGKSEMAHHFTGSDGHAGKAGKEHPNEGPKGKASRPGDE